ncbi:hypothetical protein ACHAWF_002969 [Thalassiosira exigua]
MANEDDDRKAPTATTTTTTTDVALSRADKVGVAANVVLLLGYVLALLFGFYEFQGRAREPTAIVVYFLAFALLILSALVEFSVDAFSVRTVGHGRYHSGSPGWNRCFSILFLVAATLDIVAFVYWLRRQLEVEVMILLISSYVLLVMAALVLYFQWAEFRQSSAMTPSDLMANAIILVTSLLGVVLRHLQHSQNDFDDAADKLELSTLVFWLLSSVLYVATDADHLFG